MKRIAMAAWLALATLLPLAALAGAGSIEGTVRDAKTDQPVAGAQVQLKMPNGNKVTVTTDAKGYFLFNSVPPGAGYTLKVSKSNYELWQGPAGEVRDGARSNKAVAISPAGAGGAAGTVKGVVSAAGQPLAGVTVKVGSKVATTGSDGGYSVKLPAGEYPVVAKKGGYKVFKGRVKVAAGAETGSNIELKPKKK